MYKISLLFLAICGCAALRAEDKPNIVYIMSDELAYFEPVSYTHLTLPTILLV